MVVISQRIVFSPERQETSDFLDQRLIDLMLRIGASPIPVPNSLNRAKKLSDWLNRLNPKGILLSGGNDLGEFQERDSTETELIKYAKVNSLPLLGICRGMQMLASWAGVSLKKIPHHVKCRHPLAGEITGEVNSYHNYSISVCPSDFIILARSEDREIEAIRHVKLPWEGWMWHPERESSFREIDLKRLRGLFHE